MTSAERRKLMIAAINHDFMVSDVELVNRMIKDGIYARSSRQQALQTMWSVRRSIAVGKNLKPGQSFHWHKEAPQFLSPPTKINYAIGDATDPTPSDGNTVIVHCCNDVGAWGAGFTRAISNRWDEPERQYREHCKVAHVQGGYVQLVPVETKLMVANLVGQAGVINPEYPGLIPVRYGWLEAGFAYLGALSERLSISKWVMPRIGCGLAGGNWDDVSRIISRRLPEIVEVYDLP